MGFVVRDTVVITYADGRRFRALVTDLTVTQPSKTMQTAAGHSFRVPVGGPSGSLKFTDFEEIEAPPLPPVAPKAPETEDPAWGTWS